jgi:hypothetical protein
MVRLASSERSRDVKGSVLPLPGFYAGSRLTGWLGFGQVGLESCAILTPWVTTVRFMDFRLFPTLWAFLGASASLVGVMCQFQDRVSASTLF